MWGEEERETALIFISILFEQVFPKFKRHYRFLGFLFYLKSLIKVKIVQFFFKQCSCTILFKISIKLVFLFFKTVFTKLCFNVFEMKSIFVI